MNKTRASILVAALATSLLVGIVPAAQAELRVGENYRLGSDSAQFRGKDTVALATNPSNPQHIVEVNANYLNQECEYTVSRDGGTTWSAAKSFAKPDPGAGEPFVPTCRASDHLADFMFQTVEFGSGQNVYATFSTPRGGVGGGEQGSSVLVAKSTDGGSNFAPAVIAIAGGLSGATGPYYELPSVAVDPGFGQNGADRVIVAAREVTAFGEPGGDAVTALSNDGGQTFSAPVQVEPAGEAVAGPDTTSPPVVLPNHQLAIAWRTSGTAGSIRVARGTVTGNTLTWAPPSTAATVTNTGSTGSGTNPPTPLPSNGSSFPRMAVDKVSGNLYLVYNQGPAAPGAPAGGFTAADHFISPDSDVYFQRSLNFTTAATWSNPQLINDASKKPGHESPYNPRALGVVTQTRHPDVAVAPNGRVDIVWEDRRHWYRGCVHTHVRCEEARLGDTYYAFSNNAGGAFSPNKRINDRSHGNDVGYDYRFGVGWAFGPTLTHLGNSQLLVGWMDSREGNFDDDNLDIYLAKVNHNGPAGVPQESIVRSGPADTSVRLSKHTYPGGGEGLLASTFATRNGTRVVIVNENDTPAILAAGVLARANLSQVLLAPAGGLPASVKAEVDRLNPAGAYVIGDAASLSGQVVQDLEAAGVPNVVPGQPNQIERLGGANDAATARAIAEELDRRNPLERAEGMPAFNAVTVVNPDSPDASAAAGLAAARRLPILFVNQNSIPQDTQAVLSGPLGIDKALVIGGTQWVSAGVAAQLPAAKRLGGADQYATSRAVVAESLERGLPDNIAYVADGARPIDGALLGSTVGRVTGLLLLSPAPLTTTAAGTAGANGLSARLDRLILLRPVVAAPPGGGNPPAGYPLPKAAFAGCPILTANVIQGTAASNTITGTPLGDRIFAGTGDDKVDGIGGGDCIALGLGEDVGEGGLGNDLVLGEGGTDKINGDAGSDRLRGGSGSDRVNGGFGNDAIHGQSGKDTLIGSRGRDGIRGGLGQDVISAGSGNDRVAGHQGNDGIRGGSGNDVLRANSGNDRVAGGSGRDRIFGARGADGLRGNAGNDLIVAGAGRDRVSGGKGRDRVNARDGRRDRINCGPGRDTVIADRSDVVARNCERVRRR